MLEGLSDVLSRELKQLVVLNSQKSTTEWKELVHRHIKFKMVDNPKISVIDRILLMMIIPILLTLDSGIPRDPFLILLLTLGLEITDIYRLIMLYQIAFMQCERNILRVPRRSMCLNVITYKWDIILH